MSLRDRILSDTNIYAAIHALPNNLREKSLICGDQQQYLKDLREVYRYGASHDKFISHCKDKFFENDIRNNHPINSATIIRKGRLGFELDEFVRNAVAIISETHGAEAEDIYAHNDEPEIINSQKLLNNRSEYYSTNFSVEYKYSDAEQMGRHIPFISRYLDGNSSTEMPTNLEDELDDLPF